jgi:2,4-dienoyl-CoA reductase (NADPH2)
VDAAKIEALIGNGLVQAAALARPIFSNPDWAAEAERGVALPSSCACDPPSCLRTQLTGAICSHWPQDRQDAGFWGREPISRRERAS